MKSDDIRKKLENLHHSAFGWAMVCCARQRDLAVDVLQEAYCRILGGDAKFSGKSDFTTWLFGVIRNIAYEEARRQRKQRIEVSSLTDSQAALDDTLENLERMESSQQLNSALANLSDRQRQVLHLTFYEGMTIQQAANVLEISIGSARQHYQRGKVALHRLLSVTREC